MAKLAQKRSDAPETAPFSFTIQGIWQPNDPPAARWEMRFFSSCVRWVFNRLQEIPKEGANLNLPVAEQPLNRIKREAQRVFRLNSRYVADAIKEARAVIESQKALLPIQIQGCVCQDGVKRFLGSLGIIRYPVRKLGCGTPGGGACPP